MNSFLNNRNTTATVVYILLIVLLSIRLGGAVSHYCFDGLEPPMSIHFDNLNGHDDHEGEVGHTDVEKQLLSDNLHSKMFEVESMLVIAALFLITLLSQSAGPGYFQLALQKSANAKNFQPPLRAPPLTS
ncbi:MAG: hypothetical protein HQ498_13010 [Pseudohongiella sp.]|nr:hypothetical protein [Pseudohongiella sp.]